MKLPILTKKKTVNDKVLFLDISETKIKGLAVYFDVQKRSAKIIGHSYTYLEDPCIQAGMIIDRDIVATKIKGIAEEIEKNMETSLDQAILAISSEACIELTTTARLKHTTKQEITNKDIQLLENTIMEESLIQAQEEYTQITGDIDTNLEIITSANVVTKADGRNITDLEMYKASVVEMAQYNSYIPQTYIEAYEKTLKKSKITLLAIGSKMYAITQALLKTSEEFTDFIIINIEDSLTTVGVIFSKGLISTKTLNIGFYHFAKNLSYHMGITIPEAIKVLKTYISGELSNSENYVIQPYIKETLHIWLKGLELIFAEFKGVKTFAHTIYVTGEGSDIPEVWDALKKEPWTKAIPFKAPPTFKKLTLLDLGKVSDATGTLTSSEWIPLASSTIIGLEMINN